MPRLMVNEIDLETYKVPGGGSIQFSAIRPSDLGASEYSLITMVIDVTGSVSSFAPDLLKMMKAIVEACKKSPRAENLLLRVLTFNYNTNIQELHGFKLLSLINANDYKLPSCDGMTALFDATYQAVTSTLTYSKTLIDQDFNVNGAIYIITDGEDNNSRLATKNMISLAVQDSKKSEVIESLITVLVGVNASNCRSALEGFQKEAGLTQYVDVGDATPQKLAKLAAFVSKSISSQSQALGTGSASQPVSLTF